MAEKVKIQVAPNLEMNIDITSDNLTDIQVSLMEEELERLEKSLTAELKEDNEQLEHAQKRLSKGIEDFGHDFVQDVEDTLLPPMKKLGFKGVHATFAGTVLDNGKVAISFGLGIDGKRETDCFTTGSIQAHKNVMPNKSLKLLIDQHGEAKKKVKETGDRLIKVKENLGNISKLERKARAQMARQLLETTDTGKQILGMLSSRKALTMNKD